jgi:hypothetical protein
VLSSEGKGGREGGRERAGHGREEGRLEMLMLGSFKGRRTTWRAQLDLPQIR